MRRDRRRGGNRGRGVVLSKVGGPIRNVSSVLVAGWVDGQIVESGGWRLRIRRGFRRLLVV